MPARDHLLVPVAGVRQDATQGRRDSAGRLG